MMQDIEKLVYQVILLLEKQAKAPEREQLIKLVRAQANVMSMAEHSFDEDSIEVATKTVESRFSTTMKLGALLNADDYRPWLQRREGEIAPFYYWDRYSSALLKKSFPPLVINSLDKVTHKILDNLEDPEKNGSWARKGMVVGHVQSGKTANYNGLICKAADAGYKVIVVLAGMTNSLRDQTQIRLDEDFLGYCTYRKKIIGSGFFDSSRLPVCLTNSIQDFKKGSADSIIMPLPAVKEPLVVILKKNLSIMKRFYEWIKDNNSELVLNDYPLLLIDDEADHGSIDTSKDPDKPTKINAMIRNILSIFSKSSFVGYTATPFANVFIDPDSEHEMLTGENYKDIFPRDFIICLDPPDNYIGPEQVFPKYQESEYVRYITDNEDDKGFGPLPSRHKIHFDPEMPKSLEESICSFVIAVAIRIIRGQSEKNHSMMVNASRFKDVQIRLSALIKDRVLIFKHSINNYAALQFNKAIANKEISIIYRVWQKEFSESCPDWNSVQKTLKSAISPLEVLTINSKSPDVLNYDRSSYPDGRTVIAVGGISLSRGLTLEGLLTSYFLRNSIMYDTLLQMGRWFGYRDGFADLCRIYMTHEAVDWYTHISSANKELRDDFKAMEKAKLTPREFGFRVRSDPSSLIVTARNKMQSGKRVRRTISFRGALIETYTVHAQQKYLNANLKLLDELVLAVSNDSGAKYEELKKGHLWRSVGMNIISSHIAKYENHPQCYKCDPQPVVKYLKKLETNKGLKIDVFLRSLSRGTSRDVSGFQIKMEKRNPRVDESKISFSKNRVASRGDESIGLSTTEIERAENEEYNGKNPPDKIYRKHRKNPLLMIHFIEIENKDVPGSSLTVPAFGISFPGESIHNYQDPSAVEYIVTAKYWEDHHSQELDERELDD